MGASTHAVVAIGRGSVTFARSFPLRCCSHFFEQPPASLIERPCTAIGALFTAPLFVALSPAFTLFPVPLLVGSQALPAAALDGFLPLWIAYAPGNGKAASARVPVGARTAQKTQKTQ
jgi:hypothetical protein